MYVMNLLQEYLFHNTGITYIADVCKTEPNICTSYSATLQLISEISKLNVAPLKKWRDEGIVFKFWGDNVDKQQKVRDI